MKHWGFPFSPKFSNSWLEIKWNRPLFRFGPTGPLWLIWSFRSVRRKCSFPFHNCCPVSTALLYPAYQYNKQTRGGLGQVCATGMYRSIGQVEFPKFQTGIFLNGKRSLTRDSQIEVFCCIGYLGHWTHQNNKTFAAPAFLKSRKWARSRRSFQSLPLIAAYRYLSYSGIQIFQKANLFKLSLAFIYSI